ncbi:hypothetical protein ACP70R_037927 [Stipagrostis hirtigluma subsp. patula]
MHAADMVDRPAGGRNQEPPVARAEGAAVSDDESDGEFEFPFVSRDEPASGGAAAADELFAAGRVRTFYPVFGRPFDGDDAAAAGQRAPLGRLFQLEGARNSSVASTSSSSSSASAEGAAGLEGASPDSYCLWTPRSSSAASSPSRPPRKSGSTGSMARWRRIGELVVGRSHSDGREKFLFLSAPPSPARDRAPTNPKAKPPRANKPAAAAASEVDTVAAGRQMAYGAKASTGARRTFLPYRQDLVGLFANMHGLRRSHHPF